MEIKLTAEWILSQGDEIYFTKGKGIIIMYDYDFKYRLIELALDTLNVRCETEDWSEENDNGSVSDFFKFSF